MVLVRFQPREYMPRIEPLSWLQVANERDPQRDGMSPWFHGGLSPAQPDFYERHFTDGTYRHYWCGQGWRSKKDGPLHWRQAGDYPAWRSIGVT